MLHQYFVGTFYTAMHLQVQTFNLLLYVITVKLVILIKYRFKPSRHKTDDGDSYVNHTHMNIDTINN